MSYYNGTLPSSDQWSGYLTNVQAQFSEHSRLILILLINAPVIAVILNILGQLVNTFFHRFSLKFMYLLLFQGPTEKSYRPSYCLPLASFCWLSDRVW